MIRHVLHTAIDKHKWDLCISQSTNESIFVYSWYLDAVCENWEAFVLNEYEAVFPIAVKSKYGFSYIYQPFFTRYFGVFSKTPSSPELVQLFFSSISASYKQFQFCLHESNEAMKLSVSKVVKQFQYLELSSSYENLQNSYSKNVKRNLKKAMQQNFYVSKNIAAEEIVELFKRTKGNDLEIFHSEHYQSLIRLMNSCLIHNMGLSIAVYKDETLQAASFFMKCNNRFIYLKSGITESGKDRGAMHWLMDSFIKEHSESNYVLDFGGSTVESVARFYKSFGAKDCVYLELKQGSLFKLMKWFKSFKF
jgi:hypothetical protein